MWIVLSDFKKFLEEETELEASEISVQNDHSVEESVGVVGTCVVCHAQPLNPCFSSPSDMSSAVFNVRDHVLVTCPVFCVVCVSFVNNGSENSRLWRGSTCV